jgi:hypothetical protein
MKQIRKQEKEKKGKRKIKIKRASGTHSAQ